MKNYAKGAALVAGLSLAATFSAVAEAAQFTLPGGGVVTYDQNNVAQGGTGTLAGTLQQGGTSTSFSCTYDAVSGQISGGTSCAQIIAGANPTDLERQFVAARVASASNLQAKTNLRLLDDVLQRQLGDNTILSVQAASLGGDKAFGESSFGPTAFAGGSFVEDNRAGFEKEGDNYITTVGVDHAAGNTLAGGFVGYQTSHLDLQGLNGEQSSDGWLAGAYVTQVASSKRYALTLAGNYGESDVDLSRTFTGTAVSANYGHTEYSGSATLNAALIATDNLSLTALAGVTYGAWKDDGYTDSRSLVFAKADGASSFAKVGGVLTYMPPFMPNGMFKPYAFATYSRLISDPDYDGRNALQLGGGLAVGWGRLTGAVEAGTVLLQSGQSSTTVGLHLRLAV